MEQHAVILALMAALLAAGRTFFIKITDDRLLLYGTSNFFCLIIALSLIPFTGFVSAAAIPFLLLSSVAYTGSVLFQLHAFQNMDISILEPLQRAIRILVLTLASTLFLNERLGTVEIVSLTILMGAVVFVIDWKKSRRDPVSLGTTLCAAFLSGLLAFSDLMGIRASGSPLTYIVWNLLIGVPSIFLALAFYRRKLFTFMAKRWKNIASMCITDIFGYGIFLYILYSLKVASALPLMNMGIIMTALIGVFLLKENIGLLRWTALVMTVISISLTQLF